MMDKKLMEFDTFDEKIKLNIDNRNYEKKETFQKEINKLTESIARIGIQTPPILAQTNDGSYFVVAGNKRIQAIRQVPKYLQEKIDKLTADSKEKQAKFNDEITDKEREKIQNQINENEEEITEVQKILKAGKYKKFVGIVQKFENLLDEKYVEFVTNLMHSTLPQKDKAKQMYDLYERIKSQRKLAKILGMSKTNVQHFIDLWKNRDKPDDSEQDNTKNEENNFDIEDLKNIDANKIEENIKIDIKPAEAKKLKEDVKNNIKTLQSAIKYMKQLEDKIDETAKEAKKQRQINREIKKQEAETQGETAKPKRGRPAKNVITIDELKNKK